MQRDVYQQVTNRIIEALEAGSPPWVRPWSVHADALPANAVSHRPYRGINAILLTLEAQARGHARNAWITFRQATELGGRIRAGEHGSMVVFYKLQEPSGTPEEGEKRPTRAIPLIRAYTVFNVAQVEGLPEKVVPPASPPAWKTHLEAEWVLTNSGARIEHGGWQAYYQPAEDLIRLPERGLFEQAPGYYATALHELAHWTGHASRCDRQLGRRFGEHAYAMEELIAEIASAFLCAHCRIDAQLQHAAYVETWLKALRNDKRAVFTAAAKAQQAADFVLALAGDSAVAEQAA